MTISNYYRTISNSASPQPIARVLRLVLSSTHLKYPFFAITVEHGARVRGLAPGGSNNLYKLLSFLQINHCPEYSYY